MHNSNCELFKIFATDFRPTHDSDHIIVLDAGKEISKIVQLMYRESQRDAIFHTLAVNLYLQLLLINLERIYSIAVQINISDEMVRLVNEAIDEYFPSSLDFQGLAAKTGVTLEHLGRVYRKASGYSISQALKQRRLKNAAELLKNSRVVISEVAMCSGFQDLSYFFRSFKAEFSISPAEYRKRYGLK
jgi:transcriptional regulator GlxA family with amidase domain